MFKRTTEFLRSCGTTLSADTYAKRLLKSYYVTCSRKSGSDVVAQMCPHCSSFWGVGAYQMTLQSARKTASTKQLLKLMTLKKQGSLTKTQRKRLIWLQKQTSKLKMFCKFCNKVSSISLENRQKKIKSATKNEPPAKAPVVAQTAKKKKKKRKDKAAGLKLPPPVAVTKSATIQRAPPAAKTASKTQQKKLQESVRAALQLQMRAKNSANHGLNMLLK